MKFAFALTLLTMLLSFGTIAGETTTECPMMKEQNERTNPKAGLNAVKPKPKTKAGAVQQ